MSGADDRRTGPRSSCWHLWSLAVGFLVAWLAVVPAPQAASVRLAWDYPLEAGIAGHIIHYGRVKGHYTNATDVGLRGCITNFQTGRCSCTNTLSNLVNGVVYYFATTAYGSNAQPSEFSNEASWPELLVPTNQPATLLAEGCTPVNGAVDPSENVTVDFAVLNVSGQTTRNLVGTLLPQGGVLSPSRPQTYGVVETDTAPVSRPFTFTAAGSRGGTLLASVHFEDGTNDYGIMEYPLTLGQPVTNSWSATNPAPIFISATDGRVSPYPSPIAIAGVEGVISKVTLTLRALSHTWFGDLQVLLVGPQGQAALVLSDAGGNSDAIDVVLTLDDDAAAPLPDAGPIVSGSWQPTSHTPDAVLPAPAPADPFDTTLRVFAGASPNGTWQLFVADSYPTDDGGAILGGWSLTVTTTNAECCLPAHATDLGVSIRDSQDPVPLTNDFSYTIAVTNSGPLGATGVILTNLLPPEVAFVSASSSQGACSQAEGVVRCALGDLAASASATVSLVVNAHGGPILTNTASITADQPDFNPFNNLAVENTSVLVPSLMVFDASVIEDGVNLTPAVFLVRLSRPTFLTVQVDYRTFSVSAEAGLDFLPQSNRLTFLPGEVSKTIEVPVLDDSLYEGDETFLLRLTNPVNTVLARSEATGTIVDDDPIPTVSISDAVVVEGNGGRTNAVFSVSLSAPSGRPVTVSYRTTNGTALAGSDFVPVMDDIVTIPALQTSTAILIAVNGDTEVEPDETFSVVLMEATNAVLAKAVGLGTILTDDLAPILDVMGFRVTAESQLPANAEVDPGETVTVSVAIRNRGTAPTTNLMVTLRSGGGVVSPSGPQNYGVIAGYGGQLSRPFSFTAGLTNCGTLLPTFELKDGGAVLGVTTLSVLVGGGAELAIVSLGTNQSREMEHHALTGSDRGGIAVSGSRVFVTGNDATARFAVTDLSGGASLNRRYDGLVSDLSTETAYTFGHGDTPMSGAGDLLTSLLELDGATGARTGRRIDLSAPLTARPGSGIFAGYGRVMLWDGARVYEIRMPSGQVTDLGLLSLPRHQPSQNWAFWGVAENSAAGTNLVYVADSRTIVRTRIPDGATTAVGSFSNLSDMASFTVSPRLGRWYFHQEGPSQFGDGTNHSVWVGYADAAFTLGCGNAPPTIQTQPHSANVRLGGTAQFSVAVGGRAPFSFQWRKDGLPLLASGPSLTITNVQPADLGAYVVEAANPFGVTTSAVARLKLATPVPGLSDDFEPDIDYSLWLEFGGQVAANPIGDRVSGANSLWLGGDGSRFASTIPVDVSGGGTVSFWLRLADGSGYLWSWVNLPDQGVVLEASTDWGATWATLGTYASYEFYRWTHVEVAVPPFAETNATLFRWRQRTNDGPCCAHWALDDVSITAISTNDPPQITQPPVDTVVTEGRTATFAVSAAGTRPLSYQWLKDGAGLAGETAATLLIPNARFADAGGYSVIVANPVGTVTSSVVALTVQAPVFVGVFSDPQIVQVDPDPDAEAGTVRESLRALGYEPVPFTDPVAASATYSVLVFPKQEVGDLTTLLTSDQRAALSNFVWQGKVMIVHGSAGRGAGLLNALFGWSVIESPASAASYRTVQTAGTPFADDPIVLANNQTVYTLYSSSLPGEGFELYTNGASTAVALLPQGSGKAIYLGWDWNWAVPLGEQDGGWLAVLSSAVLAHDPITNAPPTVVAPPASQTTPMYRTVTFGVTITGSRPLAYQWRKEGTDLPGATSSTLSLTNVQLGDAGAYAVVVTNLYGAVTSAPATLIVRDVLEVAVFDDPLYIGNSDAVEASLASLGFGISTFTSIETAAQPGPALLFPEFTFGDPASLLSVTARSSLSNFVCGGGLVIVQGSTPVLALLNGLLTSSVVAGVNRDPYHLTTAAANTQFAGGLATLRDNQSVFTLRSDSLPLDTVGLYTNAGVTAAALWRRGAGQVIYLGWDWVDALPLGSQDGGWLLALDNAVRQAKPASNAPPVVVLQPASQTVALGINTSFAVGVSGTPPFVYEWRKNGTKLPGATASVLAIPNPQLSDAGAYSVVVTNASGAATSTVARLTVRVGLPVSVFDNPRYVDTHGNSDSGAATVLASLEYLGFIPDTFGDISGAASQRPILQFPNLVNGDLASELSSSDQVALSNFVYAGGSVILHGSWSGHTSRLLNKVFGFQVADLYGGTATPVSVTQFPLASQAAGTEFADDPAVLPNLLSVYPLAASTLPPGSVKVFGAGEETAVALIRAGVGKILYLGWDWNNASPLGSDDGGWLQVLESAVLESAVATNPVPTIVSPPTNQRVAVGSTAQFVVRARGRAPLTYQWRRNGIDLPGANNSILTLATAQIGDIGDYSVVVSNAYGMAQGVALLRLFTPGMDLFDDFEPDIDRTQWTAFGGASEANGIGESVSGINSLWFGGEGTRYALTRPLDTRHGGSVSFYLRLGDGIQFPWDGPELPQEGVVLEFSGDGGTSWVEMVRCDTEVYRAWRGVQVPIPPAARAPATLFRWRQLDNSGSNFDHWALDDVWINANSIGPRLEVQQVASELVLAWPADWSGYALQKANALARPIAWETFAPQPPVEVIAGRNVVRLPLGPASRFYRLICP